MDQVQKEPQIKKEYTEPTLEIRQHVDEVVWGFPGTTPGR
jgi:hypothetical protein